MQLSRIAGALGAALAALAIAAPARAAKYEVAIAIDDEQDLYDLSASGQISDETLETLVELYQRGIDLNGANRDELYTLPELTYEDVDAILAYREQTGWIDDPAALVEAGVITEAKLESIAAFLVIARRGTPLLATDGWARAQLRSMGALTVDKDNPKIARDRKYFGLGNAPATALQARITTLQHLTIGAAGVITHERLGEVRWDEVRGGLSAEGEGTRVSVPKFYARWETPALSAIAGSYRIGFGQRLTFDNTRLYTPNGIQADDQIFRQIDPTRGCKESAGELDVSPCDGVAGDVYVTPDFRWQDALLGVAVGARKLPVGPGHVQAFGFASYNKRDLYQYELYDRETCDDPTNDDELGCRAPQVFRRQDDPLEQTSRYSFVTLPDVFAETTVGGNAAFTYGRRAHVGVTGYTSSTDILFDGADLDFQEFSRYPRGGRFGAIGVDGAVGIGQVDVFAEVTRSFDGNPDNGGGLGAIVRAVTSLSKRDELEASLRWYDDKFANPYARAIAAPDELDGLRTRDERGVRLRYAGNFDRRLSVRGTLDLWQVETTERWNLLGYARADYSLTRQYGVGGWLQHQDKDLGSGGRGECFDVVTEIEGERIPCSGQGTTLAARVRWNPTRELGFTLQYQHELNDDPRYAPDPADPDDGGRFRQEGAVVFAGTWRPMPELSVRGRIKYLNEDLSADDYREDSVWGYAQVSYRVRARDWLRLRYDHYNYLDERSSTLTRIPEPEHWLSLEYESRF